MPIATHWATTSHVASPGLGIMSYVGDGLDSGVTYVSPVFSDRNGHLLA